MEDQCIMWHEKHMITNSVVHFTQLCFLGSSHTVWKVIWYRLLKSQVGKNGLNWFSEAELELLVLQIRIFCFWGLQKLEIWKRCPNSLSFSAFFFAEINGVAAYIDWRDECWTWSLVGTYMDKCARTHTHTNIYVIKQSKLNSHLLYVLHTQIITADEE